MADEQAFPALIAHGKKTIIDISDGGSLSVTLSCNKPITQIYDTDTQQYRPDWTVTGNDTSNAVVITPVIYIGNKQIQLNNTSLKTVVWQKRDGDNPFQTIVSSAQENINGNILSIKSNQLASSISNILTYKTIVTYEDSVTQSELTAEASITFTLITTGHVVHQVELTGAQVFKVSGTGNNASYSPANGITVTANCLNTEVIEWQYLVGDDSTSNNYGTYTEVMPLPGQAVPRSITVLPTHSIWNNHQYSVTIRCVAVSTTNSSQHFYDTFTIYKIEDTPIAFLTNENITFTADSEGKIRETTVFTTNVVGYSGMTKVQPTVNMNGITLPDGMSVSGPDYTTNANEAILTFTIAANSTLGNTSNVHGSININVTYPVSAVLTLRWSKINTGKNGESAIIFSIYAPNGSVFLNQSGTLRLDTIAYKGTTLIESGATYQWSKYGNGAWTNIEGDVGKASYYDVNGADVLSTGLYRCQMTYENITYTDVFTLEDKSDACQAVIESSNGTYIYKFDQTYTFLACRVFQNGTEIDPLKSTRFEIVPPSTGTYGEYMYQGAILQQTMLKQYNGTNWGEDLSFDVNHKHELSYTWTIRNKNSSTSTVVARTKVVYVSNEQDHFLTNDDMTLVCQVEKNNHIIAIAQYTVVYANSKSVYSNGENLLTGTSRDPSQLYFPRQTLYLQVADGWDVDPLYYGQYITLRAYIDATRVTGEYLYCVAFGYLKPNGQLGLISDNSGMLFKGNEIIASDKGYSALTIQIPSNVTKLIPMIIQNISGANTIEFHSVKMEIGTEPTEWTDYLESRLAEIIEIVEKTEVTLDILLGNNGDLNQLLSEEDEDARNQGIVMAVSKTLWEQMGTETNNKISEICNRLETSIGGFADIYSDSSSDSNVMSWLKFRAKEPALYIGQSSSDISSNNVFQTRITNKGMQFLQGSGVVAEINNNELVINKTKVNNIFQIGGLQAVEDADGSITWSWVN